jgi:hypothetical protein
MINMQEALSNVQAPGCRHKCCEEGLGRHILKNIKASVKAASTDAKSNKPSLIVVDQKFGQVICNEIGILLWLVLSNAFDSAVGTTRTTASKSVNRR